MAYTDKGTNNAARRLLRLWSPFLAPGAHVMVRGFNPVPSWVRTLSRASTRPITTDRWGAAGDWWHHCSSCGGFVTAHLLLVVGCRPRWLPSVEADTAASKAAAAEWREALEGMVSTGPLSVLAGAMPAKLACQVRVGPTALKGHGDGAGCSASTGRALS